MDAEEMIAEMLGKESDDDGGDEKVSKATPLELAAEDFLEIMKDYDSPSRARDLAACFKAMHDLAKD